MSLIIDENGKTYIALDKAQASNGIRATETMDTPTKAEIVQYIGNTDANYTHGYFYESTYDVITASVSEDLVVSQTAGVTMGDFTTNVSVFKHEMQPDRTFTFIFSKVGKPKEISVWKMIGGMSFKTLTRDTVYDNSRLHYYGWLDGENNFFFTGTEIPNANTKFYPASIDDTTVPDSTPTDWEYVSTTTRRSDDPWGMWIIGGDDTPIELSDYGIYSSSSGVTGCVLEVTYTKPVAGVNAYGWHQLNVQPAFNLANIKDYDATKNQTLNNIQGVFTWIDNN